MTSVRFFTEDVLTESTSSDARRAEGRGKDVSEIHTRLEKEEPIADCLRGAQRRQVHSKVFLWDDHDEKGAGNYVGWDGGVS